MNLSEICIVPRPTMGFLLAALIVLVGLILFWYRFSRSMPPPCMCSPRSPMRVVMISWLDIGSLEGLTGHRWEIYAQRSRILGLSGPHYAYRSLTFFKGPLISVSNFSTSIIIVNTRQAMFDLLDKRKTYATRPRWPMAELLGRQKYCDYYFYHWAFVSLIQNSSNVGFTYYGKRLKDFRKTLHKSLNPTAILKCWGDLLHEQSRELCQSLLADPERFRHIIEE